MVKCTRCGKEIEWNPRFFELVQKYERNEWKNLFPNQKKRVKERLERKGIFMILDADGTLHDCQVELARVAEQVFSDKAVYQCLICKATLIGAEIQKHFREEHENVVWYNEREEFLSDHHRDDAFWEEMTDAPTREAISDYGKWRFFYRNDILNFTLEKYVVAINEATALKKLEIPELGPKQVANLEDQGIITLKNLLELDPNDLSKKISGVSKRMLMEWKIECEKLTIPLKESSRKNQVALEALIDLERSLPHAPTDLEMDEFKILKILTNPLAENKQKLVVRLEGIAKKFIEKGLRPYYCHNCKKIHRRGEFYQDHKIYARIILNFGDLKLPNCENKKEVNITKLNENKIQYLQQLQPSTPLTINPLAKRDDLTAIYPSIDTSIKTSIAGVYYANSLSILKTLSPNTPLNLKPEPTNPHDPNAIEVIYQETKLGYIRRNLNMDLLRITNEGRSILCKFIGLKTHNQGEKVMEEGHIEISYLNREELLRIMDFGDHEKDQFLREHFSLSDENFFMKVIDQSIKKFGVWHDGNLLGSLSREQLSDEELNQNQEIGCYFYSYKPARSTYYDDDFHLYDDDYDSYEEVYDFCNEHEYLEPAEAVIFFKTFDDQKFLTVLKGILELINLGYTRNLRHFQKLGDKAADKLKQLITSNPEFKAILDLIIEQ